ncbi:hypothetical protein E2I00_012405 [Balaenoptera physalus]|uniref:Borealin n=1 Tax=Balaenoptera physalus TaxID=9770 RepID=A0A6A1QMI8_BALPH|nr:hypothetical protein E2I00_012405 [Balaenoptera physalus]
MDNLYNIEILRLPKALREMNWLDYFALGGNKRALEEAATADLDITEINKLTAEAVQTPLKSAKISFDCDFRLKGVLHPRREPGPYKEKAKVKAVGRLELSMVKPTPGLTPRFDSRVFKTPGLRTPAARERIYNVSVNGSPLADSKEIFLTVPVGGGESMRFLASDLQRIDIAQLDPEALGSIKKLSVSLGFLSTHRRPPVAFWV